MSVTEFEQPLEHNTLQRGLLVKDAEDMQHSTNVIILVLSYELTLMDSGY
jgi:hypothetical protein